MLDAQESQARKEAGMQLALEFAGEGWADRVVAEFAGWAALQKRIGLRLVTIELFRSQAKNLPESHKAWGSLPRLLKKSGLVEPALDEHGQQRYQRAASPKTHAHPVALWRLL